MNNPHLTRSKTNANLASNSNPSQAENNSVPIIVVTTAPSITTTSLPAETQSSGLSDRSTFSDPPVTSNPGNSSTEDPAELPSTRALLRKQFSSKMDNDTEDVAKMMSLFVSPLPKFNGSTPVKSFISDVKSMYSEYNENDEVTIRLLRRSLEGPAKLFFSQLMDEDREKRVIWKRGSNDSEHDLKRHGKPAWLTWKNEK
jgi:hypothetical protein